MHASNPKNGGKIHVGTNALESLFGIPSENMHPWSLSKACWMIDGVNESYPASEKVEDIQSSINITLAKAVLFSLNAFS